MGFRSTKQRRAFFASTSKRNSTKKVELDPKAWFISKRTTSRVVSSSIRRPVTKHSKTKVVKLNDNLFSFGGQIVRKGKTKRKAVKRS